MENDEVTIEADGEEDISFDDISTDNAEKIEKLKAKLKSALKEKEEYLGGWQRCRADFVNAKRMADVERLSILDSVSESYLKDLLPVLDSFELALAERNDAGLAPRSQGEVGESWRAGFLGIYSKLLDTLSRRGLKQICKVGDKFNINEQEPVVMVPVDKEELDDIVTEVLQKGYSMNGKTIRPAKVSVGQYNKKV
ncbi:MAG: nucleotide exchange factor GrpE [bacterium]|nr:nucleotide exchange factor GrpE [bacterium]